MLLGHMKLVPMRAYVGKVAAGGEWGLHLWVPALRRWVL